MRIPSTEETIQKLMGADAQKSSVERTRMKDGQPLFTPDDVRKARESLDIELRYICDFFQMGKTYFNDKCVEYYQKVMGHSRDKAKSDTQNLIRTLEKGGISDNRFKEAMRVLGFEVVDRSVTLKDDVGDLYTFSTADALVKYRAHDS